MALPGFLGMEHLHDNNLLLRDLKPDNIVLDNRFRAKLTDFGLGRYGANGPAAWSFTFPPGTPGYVSPEVIRKQFHNAKADLYSFGVVIWIVLTGGTVSTRDLPGGPIPPSAHMNNDTDFRVHENDFELLRWAIFKPNNFDARPVASRSGKNLILALISELPQKRPSHEEVRQSQFFSELDPPFPSSTSSTKVLEEWLVAHGF